MKIPKLPKLPKFFATRPRKKLHATTARRAAPQLTDSYDDEPQTKLSSAFIVVLILHVVAVGGIYAFNSIKARRHQQEQQSAAATANVKPRESQPGRPRGEVAKRPETEVASGLIANAPAGSRVHHVQAGDNLTKISSQYHVSIAEIGEANGAKNVATLHPGQTLTIPPSKAQTLIAKRTEDPPKSSNTPTAKPPARTYVVAKGDNPVAIARKLGVSYDDLIKLNKIADPKKLKPGQTLKVPAKKPN